LSREDYLDKVEALQQHIRRGDCYEINFCQEFYLENIHADPIALYRRMTAASPNPFSALYRVQDAHLVCASPERFIQKTGDAIISQPIKGTIQRSSSAADADELNRQALASSSKDRAENVMIVDLVRNDFSRICSDGSVQVEELFGIQTFPQVHHLVSTVRGMLRTDIDFAAIIRACFPMGSMTGAPKKRVMELIDTYEVSRRGIFSGAVGYIDPKGDFDFNVVIRSIMYNAQTGYLSYQAGSGITHYSNPQLEYDECLLKASAIKKVLAG
ncbi:MAG TPA: anthranilate synthase component I family protein, partial [Chitinophagaceae bacterium]|nr:anthranilate synthase component I family protein [Chitinophagaceae bacterium]